MTAILKELILTNVNKDNILAFERIKRFAKTENIPEQEFQTLSYEIGGASALDPLMQELKGNLDENFQEPISRLNEDTQKMWQKTIQAAHRGFLARMVMSVVVFIVGIIILFTSWYRAIFLNLSLEQLIGPGVSFFSALATISIVIYKGPLKDIRQSVNDLGIASAAFIAYVHRVLQISHTFSYYYLKKEITYKEMTNSSKLIEQAMKSTIHMLSSKDDKSPASDVRDEKK